MAIFEPRQNQIIDLQPSSPPPSLPLSATFVNSYLQNRTRPPFRPTPRSPYTPFDIIVFDNLPPPTTAQQLLQHLALFPASATDDLRPLLARHNVSSSGTSHVKPHPDLPSTVTRLVTSITHALKRADASFETVAEALHVLHAIALHPPHGTAIVTEALSPRDDKLAAIDKVREWAQNARAARSSDNTLCANGISWSVCADGLCASLINALMNVPPSDTVPTGRVQLLPPGTAATRSSSSSQTSQMDAAVRDVLTQFPDLPLAVAATAVRESADASDAVRKLRGGWRPQVKVGKRGAGRKVRDGRKAVGEMASFGDGVDVDWIVRRVAADAAREEMEAEIQAEQEAAAVAKGDGVDSGEGGGDGKSGWGVYDDEPDEGALEGEVPVHRSAGADDSDSDDGTGGSGVIGSYSRGGGGRRGDMGRGGGGGRGDYGGRRMHGSVGRGVGRGMSGGHGLRDLGSIGRTLPVGRVESVEGDGRGGPRLNVREEEGRRQQDVNGSGRGGGRGGGRGVRGGGRGAGRGRGRGSGGRGGSRGRGDRRNRAAAKQRGGM